MNSPPNGRAREGVLDRIVETKRRELEALRPETERLRAAAQNTPPARDFRGALIDSDAVAVIAEVKRKSPGAGLIRPDLDPIALASSYAARGARAISVLTDQEYFGGSLDDLREVKTAVEVPVLRKDFTIDPLQIMEARAAGADAVLLIARILDDALLTELYQTADTVGLAALVEVHDGAELNRAIALGADIIGINNRDLSTFTTDLSTTLDLLRDVPEGGVVVSESGIWTPDDVQRLGASGVDAVLVGEAFLRQPEPAEHVARLSGHPKVSRRG